MTPAEHIAVAEQTLDMVRDTRTELMTSDDIATILMAIGHALIAIAVESGVPHQTTTPGVV